MKTWLVSSAITSAKGASRKTSPCERVLPLVGKKRVYPGCRADLGQGGDQALPLSLQGVERRPYQSLLQSVRLAASRCPGLWGQIGRCLCSGNSGEAPRSIRENLLAGLLRGDGDVYLAKQNTSTTKAGRAYQHRMNAATVGFFSSSPTLFQQVSLLLQGLGFYPTFRRDKPYMRLYGEEQLHDSFLSSPAAHARSWSHISAERSKPMAVTPARATRRLLLP